MAVSPFRRAMRATRRSSVEENYASGNVSAASLQRERLARSGLPVNATIRSQNRARPAPRSREDGGGTLVGWRALSR
jgi:hypothetical protein